MKALADTVYAACNSPAKLLFGHPDPSATRRIAESLKHDIRSARRFYVDAEATAAAVELGSQHPDLLLQMLHRARLPFAKVWVEWDNNAACEAAGLEADDTRQERVGMLIERLDDSEPLYRLTTISEMTGHRRGSVVLQPFSTIYHLTKPAAEFVSGRDLESMAGITRFKPGDIRKLALGGVYVGSREDTDDSEAVDFRIGRCAEFISHAEFVFAPHTADLWRDLAERSRNGRPDEQSHTILRNNLLEESGTLRNLIAILALINARDYVESDSSQRAAKSRFAGGKVVPYLDHWLVKLKLPRKVVTARVILDLAEALPRRRHEVIGHWKHSRTVGDPTCSHAYVDQTPTRQVCAICSAKRWWVNEFMRGDASVGMVLKDRLVTLD